MKNKLLVIEQLKTNPIIQIVCQKTGISRATYYRWREKNKKFKESSDKALKEGISFINDLAESQLLSSIKDKNMTAIIFWLKNNNSNYADKIKVSTDKVVVNDNLTPEEEKLVRRALKMAGIINFKKPKNDKQKTKS